MSTTEKELKKVEDGTCSTGVCSTTHSTADKNIKADEIKVLEAALAAEKAKKEKSGGCCG